VKIIMAEDVLGTDQFEFGSVNELWMQLGY
jgi:hypothetical protein